MSKLYLHSLSYAVANNEKGQLRASFNESLLCRKRMRVSFDAHRNESRLDSEAIVREIASEFGAERMLLHLALSLQGKDWNIRFSQENIAWAENFLAERTPDEIYGPYRTLTLDETYSHLLDTVTTTAREMYA